MTVTNNKTRKDYTLDGTTTRWDYDFKIFEGSNLQVIKRSLTGIETTLIYGTDYTVTGANTPGGGSVVLTSPGVAGERLTIRRNLPQTQGFSFRNQKDFFAERHEDAYDYVTMLIQQQGEVASRAIVMPATFPGSGEIQNLIPGYALGVSADGTKLECVANTGAEQSADLANTTEAIRGAGMVGYTYSLAYAPGTMGRAMKDMTDLGGLLQVLAANAQCRLEYVSSTVVRLSPWNGNKILVNRAVRTIPDTGVILAPNGLAINTLHYVYVYWNGTALALEASTTGHMLDSLTGMRVKQNDVSRTLVGMVYLRTTNTFEWSEGVRLVASWFNRKRVTSQLSGGAFGNSSNAATKVTGLEQFVLSWSDVPIVASIQGAGVAQVGANVNTYCGIDGPAPEKIIAATRFVSASANQYGNLSGQGARYVTEGYHTITFYTAAGNSSYTELWYPQLCVEVCI